MKRRKLFTTILAALMAVAMVFALAACGGSGGAAPAASEAASEAAEAVSEAAGEAAEAVTEAAEAVSEAAEAAEDSGAADSGKFIMGIDPEYPPFSYLGDDGKYTGFDVDVCQAACDKLGLELEIFSVNWDNKLQQLDSFECDCIWSGMTILDSMKEAGYVISAPYFDNTQVLLVKADSGITSSADLAGKDVAVQLGTSGDQLLQEDLADLAGTFNNVITCDSFLKCFTELDGNAVDAVFVDYPVAKAYQSEHEGFVILDEELGGEQYGIAFRSSDQELCDKIEGAIQELVADGTYKEIAEKYPDIVDSLVFLQ